MHSSSHNGGRLRSGEERPVSPVPSSRVDRGRQRPRGLQSFALPDGIACRSPAGASYPEGNFGGNQLLDGSIGLSPLHPVPTIDLHVRGASDFHQSFLWLRPDRAWIAIFRVPGRLLHLSRSGNAGGRASVAANARTRPGNDASKRRPARSETATSCHVLAFAVPSEFAK